jgi:glycosyltransferase involved in cell wall biosynthesis
MNIWYFYMDPRPTSSDNTKAPTVHITETIHAFRTLGHQVHYFLYRDAIGEKQKRRRQTAQKMSQENTLVRTVKPLLRDVYELYRDRQDVNIVDAVFQDNHIDLVYERLSQHKSSVSLCASKHRVPLIIESNAPVEERKQYWGAPLFYITKRLERTILKRADAVTVVSSPLKDYYVNMGIDAQKIFVLPNGVNHERFSPKNVSQDVRGELGLGDKIVIGFVGNIFAYHGIELFLPLARIYAQSNSNVHFLIVGGGQERGELRSALYREHLSHLFTFVDPIPNSEVPNFIAAMDICILPRFMWYGSPMKIFEYGAMGKVIVAPDQENIRDTLAHGETAFLFESGNTQALISATQVLTKDDQLRARLGDAARQHILTHHTWTRNAERILNIYRQIIT